MAPENPSPPYPESPRDVLGRLRDHPDAFDHEVGAIKEALPDILKLIEADEALDQLCDRVHPMSDDERRDGIEAQRWERRVALTALSTRK